MQIISQKIFSAYYLVILMISNLIFNCNYFNLKKFLCKIKLTPKIIKRMKFFFKNISHSIPAKSEECRMFVVSMSVLVSVIIVKSWRESLVASLGSFLSSFLVWQYSLQQLLRLWRLRVMRRRKQGRCMMMCIMLE